jgi:hypothetical protein
MQDYTTLTFKSSTKDLVVNLYFENLNTRQALLKAIACLQQELDNTPIK